MPRPIGVLLVLLALLAGCVADGSVPGPGSPDATGKADSDAPDLATDAPEPRVELKVTIHPDDIEWAMEALGLDQNDAERRYVTFYDTADLALFESGLVLRSRKVIDDDDDSTVKMRPMTTDEAWALIPEYFDEEEFKCEIDRTPGREVSSCSLSATQDRGEIDEVAAGERDVDKLFSSEQEELVALFAPEGFDWDDLEVLGPVDTQRWKIEPVELDARLTVELWEMPDGGLLMELSIKVELEESEAAMADLLDFVADHWLTLDDAQTTKTRRVLSYFAAERDL